ncbi:MAG: hypothetical protein JRF63_10400, partial [Deltaproteobacteria bacterium]|nr:hypothetical protein [Deltaproteobacteria bacterium]
MLVIGVDENGLGPLLGPLVVTAAAFEVDEYDRDGMWAAVPDDLRADDSKRLFSRATMAAAERHTLAWLAAFGVDTSTHAELTRSICRPVPWAMPCEGGEPGQSVAFGRGHGCAREQPLGVVGAEIVRH